MEKFINLGELRTSMERVKTYADELLKKESDISSGAVSLLDSKKEDRRFYAKINIPVSSWEPCTFGEYSFLAHVPFAGIENDSFSFAQVPFESVEEALKCGFSQMTKGKKDNMVFYAKKKPAAALNVFVSAEKVI